MDAAEATDAASFDCQASAAGQDAGPSEIQRHVRFNGDGVGIVFQQNFLTGKHFTFAQYALAGEYLP